MLYIMKNAVMPPSLIASSKKTQKAMIERAAEVYTPGMTDETLWSLLQSKRNLVEPNNPKE